TSRAVARLPGHFGGVASLAWSPDGKTLAVGDGGRLGSAARDAFVHLWDTKTGAHKRKWAAHLSVVGSLAFFDGGRMLGTTGWDGRVRWWRVADGKRLGQMRDLQSPRFLPGGSGQAVFLNGDGALWSLRGDEPGPRRMAAATPQVGPWAALTGRGEALVAAGEECRVLGVPSGKELRRLRPAQAIRD